MNPLIICVSLLQCGRTITHSPTLRQTRPGDIIYSDGEWELFCVNEPPIPLSGSNRLGSAHEIFLLLRSFSPCAVLALVRSPFVSRATKMEKRDPRQGVEATPMRWPKMPSAWRTMKSTITNTAVPAGLGRNAANLGFFDERPLCAAKTGPSAIGALTPCGYSEDVEFDPCGPPQLPSQK